MSGHSKWNNIKRKKEGTDAKRAKIFTKIGREIALAVKAGGPNPASNTSMRDDTAKTKICTIANYNVLCNTYASCKEHILTYLNIAHNITTTTNDGIFSYHIVMANRC